VPGWGRDAGEDQFRSIAQFWGCATGKAAELNLNSDEERAAYIERANNDPAVMAALVGCINYMHFEITQVMNIVQECGFDFEQASGKVNGIDMDHDGFLDRDADGNLILQNYDAHILPDYAYELDQNLGWWFSGAYLIDEHGSKIIGANPDGTPIVEGAAAALAENEFIGYGEGKNGTIKVKVTMDGDKIAKIEVLSHNETAGISDPAFAAIPEAIIAANSTEVDVVSGATKTSEALIAAVNDALAQIGK
jgi:uncharacterized protein with FMN-binding domain